MTEATASLEEWAEHIDQQEMPVFRHTAQRIVSVTGDDDAPAQALAQAVLEDASMTARVLKVANSTFYNPREQSISTVSRAVILLGFDTVQNIALSIALVDSLVNKTARERLTEGLARAIHAAVQARAIASKRGERRAEEIFIATLLYPIGELAFWCFGGRLGDALDAAMRQPGYTPERAQEEVLGFRLSQLSANLAQRWNFNELLTYSLANPGSKDPRVRAVTETHALAAVTARHGWHSPEANALTQGLASLAQMKPKELSEMLHQNAREAVRIAGLYGAGAASKAIPMPSKYAEQMAEEQAAAQEAEAPPPRYVEPDGMLQLKILRELSLLLQGSVNFNLVMELVLEGIYRGVGMDRTLFALLTPDRRALRAKFALGEERQLLVERFHFLRHPQQRNLFFELTERKACVWYDAKQRPELAPYVGSAVTTAVGLAPFYTCPIVVNGTCIGLFYADRGPSSRPLDQESFDSFRHFAKQASLGLSLASGGKKPAK